MQGIQQRVRFASFLSPLLYETYKYIARYVGEKIGQESVLGLGERLELFADGEIDAAFLCGLLYVRQAQQKLCPIELLAAPVLEGERYQERPIYFSDVVVRQEAPFASLADLAGGTWAYNERASHSGYNLVCYSLLERGKQAGYFGKTLASGSHLQSLQIVLAGQADATALDSHILDVWRQRDPELASRIRIIDTFGPSAIPPIVAATTLDSALKREIQHVLLTMHNDPIAAAHLREGCIKRFVEVHDEHYNDIRHMLTRVQGAPQPYI